MKKLMMILLLPGFLLATLENEVHRDLDLIGVELARNESIKKDILDVAIIGGGQVGMCLCLALQKEHIFNVAIFDQAPEHIRGQWQTTARMLALRSNKNLLYTMALGIPHLTFKAWYQEKYGHWDSLVKVPTLVWAEYLQWYGKVLNLPIKSEWKLLAIQPEGKRFKLLFNNDRIAYARKVVLATGRSGLGGFEIPGFVSNLSKNFWHHTGEVFHPSMFKDKKICIIGAGASAFDAAATALEAGAEKVEMFMRRQNYPNSHMDEELSDWTGVYYLDPDERSKYFEEALDIGVPPPLESIARVKHWSNFKLYRNTQVESVRCNNYLTIKTNQGTFTADHIILGTGYKVDLEAVPELFPFCKDILLWKDEMPELSTKLGLFPYLGPHFEFLEKIPRTIPFLKNIHCFNYGCFLSHGRIAGDLDQLYIGAQRLAEGIKVDLFIEDLDQ